MMMALGLFVFAIDTLAYQELQRRSSWKHATTSLVGARDASQYLGPGEDVVTLTGSVVPEFGTLASLDTIRSMADQGLAWALVEGTGRIYGAYVITDMQETKSLFFVDGLPRKTEFSVTLRRVDQGTEEGAETDMGDLGSAARANGVAL
ncbi:MAG: phage tail protein [Xanthomonadaceae bacterium]|nr:phage tail protein [Xanthomonadaceae bacterium]